MKQNKGLKFTTERERKALKTKQFFLGFLSFVIIFGAISVVALLKHYDWDISSIFSGEEKTTQSAVTEPVLPTAQGEAVFLIACASDSGELHFTALVQVDAKNCEAKVSALSPQAVSWIEESGMTLEEHFRQYGIQRLKSAVESYTGVTVDRYAYSKEKQFRDIITNLGGLTINVESAIKYDKAGLRLNMSGGRQNVKGQILLNYMIYLSRERSDGQSVQAQLICSMLETYMTKTNFDKGENFFSSIRNSIESDVSIVDYTNSLKALEAITHPANEFKATPADFSEF